MPTPERVLARFMGGPDITWVREPGHHGRDQPEARWRVGRTATVFADDGRPYVGVLRDWFQPDGDPRLTIYVFEHTNHPPERAP